MMTSSTIETAMRRALSLASRGPANGINPRVGCVILSADGDVLAEGWHRGVGTPHAEVDALSKLALSKLALSKLAPDAAAGATAVVTLEPCNHVGRTGPCSEALITAGIARVVYAISDPSELANGGAERLRDAGVVVEKGVLAHDAEEFLRVWLTSVRLGRPFVTLKWAASLDGRAAAADGSSQWITGAAARLHVHEHRAAADAIIVGTGTILSDDPTLTARGEAQELLPHQPIPVVIGERPIPVGAKVLEHPHPVIASGSRDLPATLAELFASGIRHVLVEGGPTLASAFVRAGLVDEYLVYLAPLLLGGGGLAIGDIGVDTLGEAKHLAITSVESLGDDLVITATPDAAARAPRATTEPAARAPRNTTELAAPEAPRTAPHGRTS